MTDKGAAPRRGEPAPDRDTPRDAAATGDLNPQRLATILDSISDGVFTVDQNWRISSFNRAAERITGVPRDEALGRSCCDVFRASICEAECALRRTLETGRPVVGRAVYIVNARGDRIPISISTAILRDAAGRPLGGVETFRDLSQVEELRKELHASYTFADIVSRNHRMRELFAILPQVAASESTVLIAGESGTGKELVARAVHDLSPRREGPFVACNCGALPDQLLESELFGHRRGAFTGADRDRQGRFDAARGGTLFLDEIGDVSPALQTRLLRVLQERVFTPLGTTREERADVRVVAATHHDLETDVAAGRFREDLYYRINVVQLKLPPLRDRREDIPLLIDYFLARFGRLHGKDVVDVSPAARAALIEHDYPGNVRELENALEHAFVLCPGGQIELAHLPAKLRQMAGSPPPSAGRTLQDAERRALLDALRRNGWNRAATARELGVHRSTLFRKIAAHGIRLPEKDGRHRSN